MTRAHFNFTLRMGTLLGTVNLRFYRAMHVVLARRAVLLSQVVRPSVCLSVTLIYRGYIGWTSPKAPRGSIRLVGLGERRKLTQWGRGEACSRQVK